MPRTLTGDITVTDSCFRIGMSLFCARKTPAYMLELVRYVHLNPVRAGVVLELDGLDRYRFCGHGALLKRFECEWRDRDYVLVRSGGGGTP